MSAPRQQARQGFDANGRIRLLEDDADDMEAAGVRLEAAIQAAKSEMQSELDGVKKILVGILISVTTASILLVVNILVIGSRG